MPIQTEAGALARRRDYHVNVTQADYFIVRHLHDFIAAELREHLTTRQRVADIGCGEQPWRGQIEAQAHQYIGVDVSDNRQHTVALRASAEALPLAAGSIDLVLCTEVLEHVSDSFAAVQELGRLLSRGGCLLITTPFIYPLHEEPHDFARLTPHQMQRYAQRTGLHLERLELAGNEVEVLATIWSNIWSRLWPGPEAGFLRKLLRRVLITCGNLPAALISRLVGAHLPHKAGLCVMCVLIKD